MAKYGSVYCPDRNDHRNPRLLFFVGDEEIYVECGLHKWIKVVFKRGNEVIKFTDSAVRAEAMGEGFHFDHKPLPVLALGEFKLKNKLKEKWQT